MKQQDKEYIELQEKIKKDLQEKGYVDRKLFQKYLFWKDRKGRNNIYQQILEEEGNPVKKFFTFFLVAVLS